MSSIRHSLPFSRLPVPYWQDGLNIYVQFQESATTMLSIQTVNGFLNKMGNTWASNLMCDHWSSPILRGFNKAIFWFQQSWPKIRAQCSRWLMPWFWRQRVADVQLLTLWMTWAPHYTTKFLSPISLRLACVMCMSVPLQLERHFSACVYSAGWVVCYIVMS